MNFPQQELPRRRSQTGLIAGLAIGSILVCAACFLLAAFLLFPTGGRTGSLPIPLTGGQATATPVPTAVPDPPGGEAQPEPVMPAPLPGTDYRFQAERQLELCFASFHSFFILHQMAVNEPGVMSDGGWRDRAGLALAAFRGDCETLGNLAKEPPVSYSEVDRWLKLAAAEVGPAADSFLALMDMEEAVLYDQTAHHLLKFLDYTENAQLALLNLQERKEI